MRLGGESERMGSPSLSHTVVNIRTASCARSLSDAHSHFMYRHCPRLHPMFCSIVDGIAGTKSKAVEASTS